jgi:hypothetical protein
VVRQAQGASDPCPGYKPRRKAYYSTNWRTPASQAGFCKSRELKNHDQENDDDQDNDDRSDNFVRSENSPVQAGLVFGFLVELFFGFSAGFFCGFPSACSSACRRSCSSASAAACPNSWRAQSNSGSAFW